MVEDNNTGIRDKSGNLIYKGDKVLYHHIVTNNPVWVVDFREGEYILKQGGLYLHLHDVDNKNNLKLKKRKGF